MYYYLYLCPIGLLAEMVEAYRTRSKEISGSNGAHQYPAHVTLTGRFYPDHNEVNTLLAVMDNQFENVKGAAVTVGALYHNAAKAAIGVEITAPTIEAVIKKVRQVLPKQKSTPRSLHLTLAADYPPADDSLLLELAQLIDLQAETKWEIRFYSVDQGKFEVVKSWVV